MHYNETNHMFEIVNLFLLQASPVYIVDNVFFVSCLCFALQEGLGNKLRGLNICSVVKKKYRTLIHGILIL